MRGQTWKSFFLSFFFFALDPILTQSKFVRMKIKVVQVKASLSPDTYPRFRSSKSAGGYSYVCYVCMLPWAEA
jgi:hypothetical protein